MILKAVDLDSYHTGIFLCGNYLLGLWRLPQIGFHVGRIEQKTPIHGVENREFPRTGVWRWAGPQETAFLRNRPRPDFLFDLLRRLIPLLINPSTKPRGFGQRALQRANDPGSQSAIAG